MNIVIEYIAVGLDVIAVLILQRMQHITFRKNDCCWNVSFALFLISDKITEHRQHNITRLVILRDPFARAITDVNMNLLTDRTDLQRIDHKQNTGRVLNMLTV
ncbi:hypothetical protein D3C71_1625730 [compost metagenome]